MNMRGYRRGWYGESYRHYLASKGVRTGGYFAKGTRTGPDEGFGRGARERSIELQSGISQRYAEQVARTLRPEAVLQRQAAEGGAGASKELLAGLKVAQGKAAQEGFSSELQAALEREAEVRAAARKGLAELSPEGYEYQRDIRAGDLDSAEIREVRARSEAAGAVAAEEITPGVRALGATLGAQVVERAKLTGSRPTSDESSELNRTEEGRAALRAAKNNADVYDSLQRATTLRGQFGTAAKGAFVESATKEFLGGGSEDRWLQRMEKEDATEAALAKRLSPGFPNPVISSTAGAPFRGSLNPFTDDDVETPILKRFDSLLGKPLVSDPDSMQGVEAQIGEVTKSSGDWSTTSVIPYSAGLSAVKMRHREPLVNSIIDLEKEEKVIREKRQIVGDLRQKALGRENVENSLVREGGDNAFALFGSTGATKIDKQLRRVEDVDAKLRKSQNAVRGRIDDLKIRYAAMRADPQVQVFSMTGVVDAPLSDVRNPVPSYLGDRTKHFGSPKDSVRTLLGTDNSVLKGNQG